MLSTEVVSYVNVEFVKTLTGTCFGTDTRVVDVDGLEIDFNPSGNMLMFNNPDAPGMLRAVAAILGEKGVR